MLWDLVCFFELAFILDDWRERLTHLEQIDATATVCKIWETSKNVWRGSLPLSGSTEKSSGKAANRRRETVLRSKINQLWWLMIIKQFDEQSWAMNLADITTHSNGPVLELIQWLQGHDCLANPLRCVLCNHAMDLTERNRDHVDGYLWFVYSTDPQLWWSVHRLSLYFCFQSRFLQSKINQELVGATFLAGRKSMWEEILLPH